MPLSVFAPQRQGQQGTVATMAPAAPCGPHQAPAAHLLGLRHASDDGGMDRLDVVPEQGLKVYAEILKGLLGYHFM